jgi:elongation factor G
VNQRRGTIIDTEVRDDEFTLIAEISLNDMFGYSSALRGATQGKGEFSMEYKVGIFVLSNTSTVSSCSYSCLQEHQPVMPHVQKEMADAYRKKLEGKSK